MFSKKRKSRLYAYVYFILGLFVGYQAVMGLLDGAVLGIGAKSIVGGFIYRTESPIYYWVMEFIDFALSVLLIIAGLKEFRKVGLSEEVLRKHKARRY